MPNLLLYMADGKSVVKIPIDIVGEKLAGQ
jgi:hypothetical protein